MEVVLYRYVANVLTQKFINLKIIDANKQNIYLYGFEMLISNFVYSLIFIILSLVTDTLIASFFFWIGLFLVRKTAGGHHSNSYISCHILFASNHIIFILLYKFLPYKWLYICIVAMLCFSIITILFFAPVDHKNKPFIKTEYKRYKLLSKIYCIILIATLIFIVSKVIAVNLTGLGFFFGTFSATVSLLCAKIIRLKERRKENEKSQKVGI
jgi:accessory gene regulator B